MKVEESWRDVAGYENMYQVSNLGRVKSCSRYVPTPNSNHSRQHLNERILRTNGGVYASVILCKNGKTKLFLVHRLVAQAFIPNPNNYPCVNHKDENPRNNIVDNLEWCTYKYNNEYNDRVQKCRDKIQKTLTGRKVTRVLTPEMHKHISDGAKRGWIKRRAREEAV